MAAVIPVGTRAALAEKTGLPIHLKIRITIP
jgi:hypothetical protein